MRHQPLIFASEFTIEEHSASALSVPTSTSTPALHPLHMSFNFNNYRLNLACMCSFCVFSPFYAVLSFTLWQLELHRLIDSQ